MKKDHLKMQDRCTIFLGLERGESFKEIAKKVRCAASTVSREIQKHTVVDRKGAVGRRFNDCKLKTKCPMINGGYTKCPHKPECQRINCYNCSYICNRDTCDYYEKDVCKKQNMPPYVCNGCETIKGKCPQQCHYEKRFYNPEEAQEEYRHTLKHSREGYRLKGEELELFSETLRNEINKGHSISHVFATYDSDPTISPPVSRGSTYNMINDGYIKGVTRSSLREATTRRPRVKANLKAIPKRELKYYLGRTYADFVLYTHNEEVNVVEMDTVEGKKGGKVFLTLFFRNSNLQLLYVLDNKSSDAVTDVFINLRQTLGSQLYRTLFPVILTDRGTEFSNPYDIECDEEGNEYTKVFYCDPQRSDQKGACERNHRELRKIFLKGRELKINQDKAYVISSHLNSEPRPKLNNKSPYQVFKALYGEDVLERLGLFYVPPKDVILMPSLLD